jgi:hypothetical protein
MLINQLQWRGYPIWPPLWCEENYSMSERGLLKKVEMLPINRLIRIEVTCAGIKISGLILTSEVYQTSLYWKLKENIGKPLTEIGKMEIELSVHKDPGSPAERNERPCHGYVPHRFYGSRRLRMNPDKAFFLWDPLGNWHYCRFCKHLHSLVEKLTCDAFPEGIPQKLLTGEIFHDKPMLGQQNDIVFASRYK